MDRQKALRHCSKINAMPLDDMILLNHAVASDETDAADHSHSPLFLSLASALGLLHCSTVFKVK